MLMISDHFNYCRERFNICFPCLTAVYSLNLIILPLKLRPKNIFKLTLNTGAIANRKFEKIVKFSLLRFHKCKENTQF